MSEMQKFEDNESRIALYLEDKMTPEEEVTFVHDLGEDEGLRQQYEEELLMQGLWEVKEEGVSGDPDLQLQGADEHIRMVETALEEKGRSAGGHGRRIPLYVRLAFAGAVLAAVVVITIWKGTGRSKSEQGTVTGGVKPMDTSGAIRQPGR